MSQTAITPERYKAYRATVNYHTPPGRQPSPAQGQEVTARAAWLMDEADPFPGELAFLIEEPVGFPLWLPQRDLLLHSELS